MTREAAEAVTGVTATSSDPAPAIQGTNTDSGPGVQGDNVANGISPGPGVVGTSVFDDGVRGTGSTGVRGRGQVGVRGESLAPQGIGVFGSGVGAGAIGVSATGVGPGSKGLSAHAEGGGTALLTSGGPVRFLEISDTGSFAVGAASASVANALVTATSHITVALNADPGGNAVVQWIQRNPGVGFTVNLTHPAKNPTPFTFLITEPTFPPAPGP